VVICATGAAQTRSTMDTRGREMRILTLFIGGVIHRGGYDPPALLAAITLRQARLSAGGGATAAGR
jgi:hypothetical protein